MTPPSYNHFLSSPNTSPHTQLPYYFDGGRGENIIFWRVQNRMDKGRLTTLISDLGLILVAIATMLGIRLDPNLATAIVSAVILIIIALLDIYHPEYKDLIDIDDSEELDGEE